MDCSCERNEHKINFNCNDIDTEADCKSSSSDENNKTYDKNQPEERCHVIHKLPPSKSIRSGVINRKQFNNNNNQKNQQYYQYEYDRLYYEQYETGSSRITKSLKRFLLLFSVATVIIIVFQFCITLSDPSRIAILPGWDRNTTRNIPIYILPNLNTTLIEPPLAICRNSDKILLLIVVCSSAVNFEIRQTIRETWANTTEFNYSVFSKIHSNFKGKYLEVNNFEWQNFTMETQSLNVNDTINAKESSQSNFLVKIVFLVGQTQNNDTQLKISDESRLYKDLIQESFIDSYNNLTLKTIMMLKWVNTNCADKVQFLMKCDDDTFVNVPNLLHILLGGTLPVYKATLFEYNEITFRTLSPLNRLKKFKQLLIGTRFCQSKPIINTSSKWYSPMYMYDKKTYPNYLSGTGYVMSMDVARRLYQASLVTPLFHLEDVYLTGICAQIAKIKPQNHQLFSYTSYKNLCEFKGMVTKHELTPTEMKKAFDFVLDLDKQCPGPTKNSKVRRVKIGSTHCN